MNDMRLWVMEDYQSGAVRYEAGQIIAVRDDTAAWLLENAPGVFMPVVQVEAMEGASDRMMRKAVVK